MTEYLSFGEVASRLGCDNKKVRQLVIEDKSLRATRITPNGLVLEECGLNGHFPYDLDFTSHLSNDGEITCDIYRLSAKGETEKTQTHFVGYLRIEIKEFERFLSEHTTFTNNGEKAGSGTTTKQKNGTRKRWTAAELHELDYYRDKHTEAETAAHFGVSGTLVRKKLSDYHKSIKPKTATPFSGLGRR